jgi:hypothetical protein
MPTIAIPPFIVESIMRRSLIGAFATDPVVPERPRKTRRSTRARLMPGRTPVARTPATARRSS